MTDFTYKYYNPGTYSQYVSIASSWSEGSFESQIALIMGKKHYLNKEEWVDFLRNCDKHIHDTLDSLSSYIQKSLTKKSDDW